MTDIFHRRLDKESGPFVFVWDQIEEHLVLASSPLRLERAVLVPKVCHFLEDECLLWVFGNSAKCQSDLPVTYQVTRFVRGLPELGQFLVQGV